MGNIMMSVSYLKKPQEKKMWEKNNKERLAMVGC